MIYVGDKEIKKAYIGDTPVKKIYRGSEVVWQDEPIVVDVIAPTFISGYPTITTLSMTSFDTQIQLDEAGIVYVVVLSEGATAPTNEEVKAGTGSGGVAPITSGSATVASANSTVSISSTGLSVGTDYDVYVIAEDDEETPNLQETPVKLDVTTEIADAEYNAVLDYATSIGVPHPSTAQQDADKALIQSLKANGAWHKADVFINYGGTADTAFRRICWKRLLQVEAIGNVIWSEDGIEGAGGYVNTKFNPTINGVNFKLFDAGILAHIGKNVAGNNTTPKPVIGGYNGSTTGYTMFVPRQTGGGGGTYYILNGGVWAESINTIGHIGLNGLYRTGGSITVIGNGQMSKVVNPDGLFDAELYMLARNTEGTATLFSDERIKYLYLGAALTETEHVELETVLV